MRSDEPLPKNALIETDMQAYDRLPPFQPALSTYTGYRENGSTPAEALQLTLALWREFRAEARPQR